jgi:hypothetical protein
VGACFFFCRAVSHSARPIVRELSLHHVEQCLVTNAASLNGLLLLRRGVRDGIGNNLVVLSIF